MKKAPVAKQQMSFRGSAEESYSGDLFVILHLMGVIKSAKMYDKILRKSSE